jgi:hypothetical protein
MTQSPTPIHETVREHYAERIKSNASCCGPSDCCSTESNLYPADLLATLPGRRIQHQLRLRRPDHPRLAGARTDRP